MGEHHKKVTTKTDAALDIVTHINTGKNVDKRLKQFFVRSDGQKRTGAAETLLFVAASQGCVIAAKRAIEEGADPNAASAKWDGKTPWQIAEEHGQSDFKSKLTASLQNKCVAAQNPNGSIASLVNTKDNEDSIMGGFGTLKKMVEHAISTDAPAKQGRTTQVSVGMLKKMVDMSPTEIMTAIDDGPDTEPQKQPPKSNALSAIKDAVTRA